jgi:6-pyruvoyltetrahydropterin/6-carboxytetrahydropterin synthase
VHRVTRCVRFSINPFLPEDNAGFNAFASKPAGEGLSLFFELSVELTGEIDPATGFVVNVLDIDEHVRQSVVPIFSRSIREDFQRGKHIALAGAALLLKSSWAQVADKFGSAKLSSLALKLNPFRKVAIDSEAGEMLYFSEKFEFAATHKLWNERFSPQRNFEVFGKCANVSGHGHNYVVEVTIKRSVSGGDFSIGNFEKVVDDELIEAVDHKNLNVDVAEFSTVNPTVENIAVFAWKRLAGKLAEAQLHCVTVWETDKTYSAYYGP